MRAWLSADGDAAEGEETRPRGWVLPVVVSTLCHLLLFGLLVYVPLPRVERRISPNIINVDLVKLPEKTADAPVTQKEAPPAKQPKTTPSKPPDEKMATKKAIKKPSAESRPKPDPEAVSLARKSTPKKKTSLKKQTFNASKTVDRALKRIEKQVAATRPDPLEEALKRLQKSVKKSEAGRRSEAVVNKGLEEQSEGISTKSWGRAKRTAETKDIYRVEIAYQIQKNWAFAEHLAGRTGKLQASLVFKVMPNGEIADIFFTDRSGNTHLDESAYKAIVKSNPVDPHPPGLSEPYIQVGLRFTPEGVR